MIKIFALLFKSQELYKFHGNISPSIFGRIRWRSCLTVSLVKCKLWPFKCVIKVNFGRISLKFISFFHKIYFEGEIFARKIRKISRKEGFFVNSFFKLKEICTYSKAMRILVKIKAFVSFLSKSA